MSTLVELPHSRDCESWVVGACIKYPEKFKAARAIVDVDDFYVAEHRAIWSALVKVSSRQSFTIVDVFEQMRDDGTDDVYGARLNTISDGIGSSFEIEHYAGIIRDHSTRRQFVRHGQELATEATDRTSDIDDLASRLATKAKSLGLRRDSTWGAPFKSLLGAVLDDVELRARMVEARGIPSGFGAVDKIIGGWQAGDLIVIAARPSHGKTSIACTFALNAAMAGRKVAVASLEMSPKALSSRLIFAEARVDQTRPRAGEMTDDDWRRVEGAFRRMCDASLSIDEFRSATVPRIGAWLRRVKDERGLDLAVIDYFQRIRPTLRGDRVQGMADACGQIKDLALELEVPIILLAQVNRRSQERENRIPALSDLKDTGALEEDADVVVFLHRAEIYYIQATQPVPAESKGKADFIVSKNRNGGIGSCKLNFEAQFARFDEHHDGAPQRPMDDIMRGYEP